MTRQLAIVDAMGRSMVNPSLGVKLLTRGLESGVSQDDVVKY
ncbi:MAG: hypothetical protein OXC54_00280 [Rhodospirillaceae bacterium]|nr:hypothetical protein [Rhodospirillaceae bacterium]